jgi:hypothetical protein
MKKAFGPWFWTAMVFVAAAVTAAWAAYLETDAGQKATESAPARVLPPDVIVRSRPDGAGVVRDVIRRVEVADPVQVEGVAVFFLTLRDGWDSEVRTLDDALRAGSLRIEEKAEASVPEVFVDNTGRRPVLLVSGEMLLGGKQNRIVRQDVLVPADSGRIAVPVYCGERDRWSGAMKGFSSAPAAAEPDLRKGAALGRAQAEIWDGIDASMKRSGVESATRDYRALQESSEVKGLLDDVVSGCRRHMPRRTVGMVVAVHRRILGADIFEDPDTFSALWEKLVRGYAVGTGLGARGTPRRIAKWDADRRDARLFLDSALECSFDGESTPGAGRLLSISGGLTGTALVWGGHAVHVALFPHGDVHPVPVPMPGPIIRRQIEE